MKLLSLYQKLQSWPFGKKIFSYLVSFYAPYFLTIRPNVHELSDSHIKVSLRKRWKVQNHIGTVHAIAICNLCEFCAGLIMEAGLPETKRWIPKSMNVSYLAKANTDLMATCDSPRVKTAGNGDFIVTVHVHDLQGKEVVRADITLWVSDKIKSAEGKHV